MDGIAGSAERTQRDELIEQYQGYVKATVRKLVSYMGLPQSRYDDFVSAGYLGLVEAAGRFDPAVNDSFQNYAFLRIRGAVIDSIRQNSEIKGAGYRRAQALSAAHEVRMEQYNRDQSARKPAASASGSFTASAESETESLESILDLAAKTALTHRLAIGDAEAELNQSEGSVRTPEQLLAEKQEKREMHRILATLPEKERLVIENFYFKDMSFTDIAENHAGLSKSWISRIHDKALEQLKKQFIKPRRSRAESPGAVEAKPSAGKKRPGRPPATERRLSGANPNKSDRKRSKSRPRTVRGGRLLRNEVTPV